MLPAVRLVVFVREPYVTLVTATCACREMPTHANARHTPRRVVESLATWLDFTEGFLI